MSSYKYSHFKRLPALLRCKMGIRFNKIVGIHVTCQYRFLSGIQIIMSVCPYLSSLCHCFRFRYLWLSTIGNSGNMSNKKNKKLTVTFSSLYCNLGRRVDMQETLWDWPKKEKLLWLLQYNFHSLSFTEHHFLVFSYLKIKYHQVSQIVLFSFGI